MDEFKKELEDYFCRFTFGQFVTLILLEIVTLFFVFYLGARYGPDLIGGRGEGSRKAQEALPSERPGSVDEIVGQKPVEYTYPEVLTRPDGERALRVKPSGVTAEEYDKQKEKQRKEGPEKSGTPISLLSAAPKGKYTLQVGSYPSAEDATAFVKRWKEKGYDAFLSVGQIPQKGTWYRVRIGGFASRDEAEAFLITFQKKEKGAALVVLSGS